MFKVRTFENRTLSWWYEERADIDMEPVYQRKGRIWSAADKAYLIDSIVNEYDIPKFYVADFTYGNTRLNYAGRKYAVIDGKQRFEAIFDFFEGRIQLPAEFQYSLDPSLALSRLSYKDLKANFPRIARQFENFNISVMSVITDDEGKINDLFVRLNNSKALTGAEVRNAMKGIVPEITRGLAGHTFFKSCVAFNTKRMQDHNVATKLLLIEHRGRFVDTKKVNLNRLVMEAVESENTDIRRASDRVIQVLDRMAVAFTPRDPILRSQGPTIPYYWLFRNIEGADGALRTFLVQFEAERQAAKKLGNGHADFPIYELLNRNTNDQGSLSGRFSILFRRFSDFAEKHGIKYSSSVESLTE